jgi:hypothetical protein
VHLQFYTNMTNGAQLDVAGAGGKHITTATSNFSVKC